MMNRDAYDPQLRHRVWDHWAADATVGYDNEDGEPPSAQDMLVTTFPAAGALEVLRPLNLVQLFMLAAVIGLVAGALCSPLLVRAVWLMRVGMPPGDIILLSAFANLLMLPSFLGATLVRRFGACFAAQVGMAASLAALTPYAPDVMLSCFLLAVFTEAAVAFATRYRDFSARRMLGAGVIVAVPALALNVLGHGFTSGASHMMLIAMASVGAAMLCAAVAALVGALAHRRAA